MSLARLSGEALRESVRGLGDSPTLAINERSAALRAAGARVFRLGLGQSPFPVPAEVVMGLRAHAEAKDYLPVRGLPALRESMAAYVRRRQDLPVSSDDVLVGPGSKELMFLLQVVFAGELLVPTPAWVSYAPQARILGQRVVTLPMTAESGWRLDPDLLEAACADGDRPRVLVLNYPSNPTGTTYEPAQLEAIAAVCRRHDVVILSDEIYGELRYDGGHVSIARYYPEGSIVATGLSKWCGAGGWRLGMFVFPKPLRWLLDAMAAVASESFTSTSAPIQHAAVVAFGESLGIERYLAAVRRLLEALVGTVRDRLVDLGCAVAPPAGGFYLYADFGPLAESLSARGIRTSRQLSSALLEEAGVAALSGQDFGRDPLELALRLALVDFDGARAMAALEHAAVTALPPDFIETYCASVIEATERIVRFVRNQPL
jgi:aspartate aminotransferase